MEPINYEKMSKEIHRAVKDAIQPLSDKVEGHNRTLYGAEGRNGMVGDVNRLKWVVGLVTTGFGVVVYWLKDHVNIFRG